MFASRYFADRFWAPRYWPRVGADAAPSTDFLDITLEIDTLLERELTVDGLCSVYLEIKGTQDVSVNVLTR